MRRCRCARRPARSPKACSKRNPQHPGARALHPARLRSRARSRARALPAARAYAKIAPAASHALHMPAHAFVQLGPVGRGRRDRPGVLGRVDRLGGAQRAVGRAARLSQPVVAALRVDAAGAVRQSRARRCRQVDAGDEGRGQRRSKSGGHHYARQRDRAGQRPDGAAQRPRIDARALRDRKRALERDERAESFDNIDELFALGHERGQARRPRPADAALRAAAEGGRGQGRTPGCASRQR